MNSIVDRRTPRVFAEVPRKLVAYASYQRAWLEGHIPDPLNNLSNRALIDCGETWRAGNDDKTWWREKLAVPDLRWIVKFQGLDTPGMLSVASADDLHNPQFTVPVAPQHVEPVIERWVTLDADRANDLKSITLSAFRQWAVHVFESAGLRMKLYGNALVASDERNQAISLLPLARAFAHVLGERASARLELLCGFVASLRCSSEDDFSWQATVGGMTLPLTALSRAMSRWSGLAVFETLRELAQSASDAAMLQLTSSNTGLLKGDVPPEILPAALPRPFSTRTAWVAMDEPEVHLFASEARLLGHTLASQAKAGRTMVVTHRLDLAARLVGGCDFLTFSAPGSFECADLPSGIESLLKSLAQHGAGILSVTRVLYVEGHWDVEILNRLFHTELSEKNALLSPFHGVDGAHLAVTSIWHRMMGTPFGVMFDSLTAEHAARKWNTINETVRLRGREYALRQLRYEIKEYKAGKREDLGLLRLFHAVIDGDLGQRLRLVMHGMSDIFQVVHPQVFDIEADSWVSAGFTGQTSFKDFVFEKARINLNDGRSCRLVVDAFDKMKHPVDLATFGQLSGQLRIFLDDDMSMIN
ncbi:hypothetical protein [Kibdelosporangium aridum]|nr:hypothetical protein [Kibdelosporangium aridum]